MHTPSSLPNPSPTASHISPLILWLLIQLLTLLAAALQLPLADHFPRPPERLAAQEMLVVQITLSAMLFPFLLRTATTATLVIAATWPFLQLAGVLSSTPAINLFHAACFLTLWLLALAMLRYVLRSDKSLLIATAAASALSLGGAILWYLRAEFLTNPPDTPWPADSLLGPIPGALSALHGQGASPRTWLPITILALASLALAASLRLRRSGSAHLTGKG